MKKQHVQLKDKDRKELADLLSSGHHSARLYKRAKALELLDDGGTYKAVAEFVKVHSVTLSDWASKYKSEGLAFLQDKPRSGRPAGLSVSDRAKITSLACSEPPEGYSRWSLRLLSEHLVELGVVVGRTQVGEILKKTSFSLTGSGSGALV